MHALKTLILFVLLFVLVQDNIYAQLCGCTACPLAVDVGESGSVNFEISGATTNTDLGGSQAVCGVVIDFNPTNILGAEITLTSPAMQSVQLVGTTTTNGIGSTFTLFDIGFVQCNDNAEPHLDQVGNPYDATWSNDQNWVVADIVGGTYYPFNGCLEDFNTGSINGNWVLSVTNNNVSPLFDSIYINDFYPIFCEPVGIDCDPCDADGGDLSSYDDLQVCQGDPELSMPITPVFSNGEPDPAEYAYRFAIGDNNGSNNNIILEYQTVFDMSGYGPGSYTVCGFSILTADVGNLGPFFPPDGMVTLGDLNNFVMGLNPPVCGDVSTDCFEIDIFPLPQSPSIAFPDTIPCTGTQSIVLEGTIPPGNPGFTWSAFNGGTLGGDLNSLTPVALTAGTYVLEIMYPASICSTSDTVQVIADTNIPVISSIATSSILDCINGEVELTSGATGQQLSFEWFNVATGISVSMMSTATVMEAGEYELVVTSGVNGCSDRETIEVFGSLDFPTAMASERDTLNCSNTSVLLDGSTSSGGTLFEWYNSAGSLLAVSDTLTVSTPDSFQLIITNISNGCKDTTFTVVVEIFDTPDAIILPPDTLNCENAIITLDGRTSMGANMNTNPVGYCWVNPSGDTIGVSDMHPVSIPGSFKLVVKDLISGCTDVDSVEVIKLDVVPDPIITADGFLNCQQDEVYLDALSSTGLNDVRYEWSDGFFVFISDTDSILVTTPGFYNLKVIDEITGCLDSTRFLVRQDTISPIPDVVLDGVISCTNANVLLDGSGSIFHTNDLDVTNSGVLEWFDPVGNSVTGTTYSTSDSGPHVLVVTDTINFCTANLNFDVPGDTSSLVAIAFPDTLNCQQTSVTLDGSDSEGPPNMTFEWQDFVGNMISGMATHDVTIPDTYRLIVSIPGTTCIDTIEIEIPEIITQPDISVTTDAGTDLNCLTPIINAEGFVDGNPFWYDDTWTLQTATSAFQITSAGTYFFVGESSTTACLDTFELVITADIGLVDAAIFPPAIITCTQDSVILNGSGSSGGALSYQWFDPIDIPLGMADTQVVFNAGTYTLVVMEVNEGCTDTTEVTVNQFADVPVAVIDSTGQLGCGSGAILLEGSNSIVTGAPEYIWIDLSDMSLISVEDSVNITEAGNYQLTVVDINSNCSSSTSIVINNIGEPTASIAMPESIDCSNISVNLIGEGSSGTGDLTYEWLYDFGEDVGDTENIIATQSGFYRLVVGHELNDCTDTTSVTVLENLSQPTAAAMLGGNDFITCAMPIAVLTPQGTMPSMPNDPMPSLGFEWFDPTGAFHGDSALEIAMIPGDYTLIVIDSVNLCKDTAMINIPGNIEPPEAIAIETAFDCEGNETVLTAEDSNGQGNLSYSWQDTFGVNYGNEIVGDIDVVGTYFLIVTDDLNGCMDTTSIAYSAEVVAIEAIAIASNELDCENTTVTLDGSTSISMNMLVYEWIDPDGMILMNFETQQVADTGEYTLIVLDQIAGCYDTTTVIVNQGSGSVNADIQISGDGQINCEFPTIELDGSNSEGDNLEYFWRDVAGNPLSNDTTLSVTTPFSYWLIVTDTMTGCTDSINQVVAESFDTPEAMAFSLDTIDCSQSTVLIDGSGSNSPFGNEIKFQWFNPMGIPLGTSDTQQASSPGEYSLVVTDSTTACTDTAFVEVIQSSDQPNAVITFSNHLNCNNENATLDGTLSSAMGRWTDGAFVDLGSLPTLTVTTPGRYYLILEDGNSMCSDTTFVVIEQYVEEPIASAQVDSLITCLSDEISLNGSASSTPGSTLLYEWQNGVGGVIGNNAIESAFGFDNYRLIVTDSLSECVDSFVVTPMVDTIPPMANAVVFDSLSCALDSVLISGIPVPQNVSYEWRNSANQIIGADIDVMVGNTGVYEFIITDLINGCSGSANVEVFSNDNNVNAAVAFPDSLGCGIETVILDGSNSEGAGLQYEWKDSLGNIVGVDTMLSVSTTGIYTLVVTDQNMTCVDSMMIEVFDCIETGDNLIAVANASGDFDCDTEGIILDATGSSDNVNYLWKDEDGATIGGNMIMTTVTEPGVYTLVVTSMDGTESDSTMVTVNALPGSLSVIATASDTLSCIVGEVLLDGMMSSGAINLIYEWQNEADVIIGMDTITTVNDPGIYTLYVSSGNGICLDSINVEVIQSSDQPNAVITFNNHLNCNNENATLDGTLSSAMGRWTDGAFVNLGSSPTLTVTTPGRYYLILEDDNSMCSDTTFVDIEQYLQEPIASAQVDSLITCLSDEISLNGSASSTPGSTLLYEWQNGVGGVIGNNAIESAFGFDNYRLIVMDSLSECIDSFVVTPMVDTIPPMPNAGVFDSLSCALDSVLLRGLFPIPQVPSVEWRNSANEIIGVDVDVFVGNAGLYEFIVTNEINGCSGSTNVEVFSNDNNVNAAIAFPDSLGCGIETVILDGSNSEGSDLQYEWKNSLGNVLGVDTMLNVSTAGTYTLVVTNQNMTCEDSMMIEVFDCIETGDNLIAVANALGDFDCDTEGIILDATGSSDNVNYLWKDEQGATIGGNMITATITEPGIYTLVVTSMDGTESDSTMVTVNAMPGNLSVIATASDTLTCFVGEVLLDGKMSSGAIDLIYEWQNEADVIIGMDTTTTVIDPGLYTLYVSSENGICLDSTNVQVFQDAGSVVANGVVEGVLTCSTQSVTLDGSGSTGGFIYEWFNPDGTSLEMSAMASTSDTGIYTLVVSNFDQTCTDMTNVEVVGNFEFPTAIVEPYSQLNCVNEFALLDLNGSIGIGDLGFNWFDEDWDLSAFGPMLEAMEQGMYYGVVTDADTGCADTIQVNVEVDFETPMGNVEIQGGFGCGMNQALLIGSSSIDSVTYQWLDDMNSMLSVNDSLDISMAGNYSLVVTLPNNGCTDTVFVDLESMGQTIVAATSVDGTINCTNTSVTISGAGSSTANNISYNWYDPEDVLFSDELSETVTIGGEYWLVVSTEMCSDTSFITVIDESQELPEAIISGPDVLTINCGDVLILDGSTTTVNDTLVATWSPMSSIDAFADTEMLQPIVGTVGWIYLSVLNTTTGCIGVDSLLIQNFQSTISAGSDTLICGEEFMLMADLPTNTTGLWTIPEGILIDDPTSPNAFISGMESGETYELVWTISADGCEDFATATVIISIEDAPTAINDDFEFAGGFGPFFFNILENDELLQSEDTYTIITEPASGTISDEGEGELEIDFATLFSGAVSFEYELCNNICPNLCDTALVNIQIDSLDINSLDFDIPNAITPNDDGINDVWIIDLILANPSLYPNNQLIIVNRWGDEVFSAQPYQNNWNGNNKSGFPLPDGTYYYILQLDIQNGLIYKGDITILR